MLLGEVIAGSGTLEFLGDGGPATNAKMTRPYGMYADTNGNVYSVDAALGRVRLIDTAQVFERLLVQLPRHSVLLVGRKSYYFCWRGKCNNR
jgi:hypothetical protein